MDSLEALPTEASHSLANEQTASLSPNSLAETAQPALRLLYLVRAEVLAVHGSCMVNAGLPLPCR